MSIRSRSGAGAVETASFNAHGGDRTQESFKVQSYTLNEIAETAGVARKTLVYAKAIWDAAEEAGDHCLHVAISQASPP